MKRSRFQLVASLLFLVPFAAACGDDEAAGGSGGSPSTTTATTTATIAASTTDATTVTSSSTGFDARFQPLVDAVEAEMADLDASGVAVAVIEDGKVTFAKGFGTKGADSMDPVLETTLFRIGSVNKVLTSAALLSEVGKGNVDLDAPVTTYVPDFDFALDHGWASTITIDHLLTHRSSMYDWLVIDAPASQQQDGALASYMTGQFGNVAFLMATSGSFWNYSNPNFYMAGLVAETTSGKPYRTLMHDAVFAPLGMDRTFFLASEVLADGDYALGSTTYPDVPDPVLPDTYENAWARPAGYATSNVLDLAKFIGFLLDGNPAVMPKALSDQMQARQVDCDILFDIFGYGYGLFVDNGILDGAKIHPIEIVSHGGDIPGFAADITYVPSQRFGFVALANNDGAHFEESKMVALKTLASLPAAVDLPSIALDPTKLAAFTGTYEDPYNLGPMIVTQVDDHLEISMPEIDAAGIPYEHELEYLADNQFIMTVQGYGMQLTFVRDPDGVSRWARTRAFVATRPTEPPPIALVPAKVTPEIRRARVDQAIRAARLR